MVKPKKYLGQHFLQDAQIIDKIIAQVKTSGCQNILEVGPGTGALSKHLMQLNKNLKVVEIDQESIIFLQKNYPALDIINEDFLNLNLESLFDGEPFLLLGNFPYNISSQILFHMLSFCPIIPEMIGMFQLEVAQRICSSPHLKTYGIISVLNQIYYQCNLLFRVPPNVFFPPPKVYSAVVHCVKNEKEWNITQFKQLKKIVRFAFQQRRKKLPNALKSEIHDKSFWLNHRFADLRAENLAGDDFLALVKEIQDYKR